MVVEYTAEFGRLDDVARAIVYGSRGSFLKAFANAWLRADPFNKRILREAWEEIIEKYDLVQDLREDRARMAVER
uniref:Uncharacterized protein n=1 Tax=viral metagenome TaxID=1070528 RepID=A0A6M3JHB1_9ZZZZ